MNSSNAFLVVTLILSFAWRATSTNTTFRITNGRDGLLKEAKYTASLHENGAYVCSGALVSHQHVVTAAECVYNKVAAHFQVSVGVAGWGDPNVRKRAEKFLFPINYSPARKGVNIAVVKTSECFPAIKTIVPIKFCTTRLRIGIEMRVSGWGKISDEADHYEPQLRTCKVHLKTWTDYYPKDQSSEYMATHFCAAGDDGSDTCIGDLGAPAVFENRLCGIATGVLGCGDPQIPGVYNKLDTSAIQEFVYDKMSE